MSNQYALILGVSSGIGRACAIELASKGLNIIGLYILSPVVKRGLPKVLKRLKLEEQMEQTI